MRTRFLMPAGIFLAAIQTVLAQANLPIYTNRLVNAFQDWSFNCTRNFSSTTTVTNGTNSISVTMTSSGYGALALQFPPGFNTAPYSSLSFWINGGSSGGQHLKVAGTVVTNSVVSTYTLPALSNNTWQQFTIPLSALGVANTNNCSGIWIQSTTSGSQPVFYVDDIQFNAAPAPATVHLNVNAGLVLRTVDARQFGLNTATWDGDLTSLQSQTIELLQEIGCLTLRWPGGSTSDTYHWASDPSGNAAFRTVATNLGAQVFTTVNYGSGTASEAAAWVLSANETNNCDFQYWEIGNECYGSWENDTHAVPHDPYTYATNAVAYIQQMKAADPAVPIKVGIVVVPGEGSYSNNATHFAINPVTGTTNYGWTPIVLSTMASQGVLPDFVIYHYYPQYTVADPTTSTESDPLLLQIAGNPSPSGWNDWASAAANLRQQITDYIGPAGTNIELCVTENNCDSGAMGKQSTSLVNALYLADSTCELMKTEFNSYIWWDLHNGADITGDFDPTLYGWRTNGDYGILSTANTPYPTFYAEKLLQYFARPGDSILNATSDYLLLSAYAVWRTNGALTVLVLNKDTIATFNAQIALADYVPWINATIQSYGIPQDQAAEYSESASLQDIATTNFPTAGTNFTYSFPPLSLTLFTFVPAPSALSVLSAQPNQVVLQLQGQADTPYVLQSSPDLMTWTPVSTNTLVGNTLNITNLVSPGSPQEFWRAVWQP